MSDLENYSPRSIFVGIAAKGAIPLSGSAEAEKNLDRLIAFTCDEDVSTRDWATMALATYGPSTDKVWNALLAAADDEHCDVRAEAIEGLARRNRQFALPIVQRELSKLECGYGVFVAANIIADPCLLSLLEQFDEDTDSPWLDNNVRDAIRACQTGVSNTHRI